MNEFLTFKTEIRKKVVNFLFVFNNDNNKTVHHLIILSSKS